MFYNYISMLQLDSYEMDVTLLGLIIMHPLPPGHHDAADYTTTPHNKSLVSMKYIMFGIHQWDFVLIIIIIINNNKKNIFASTTAITI